MCREPHFYATFLNLPARRDGFPPSEIGFPLSTKLTPTTTTTTTTTTRRRRRQRHGDYCPSLFSSSSLSSPPAVVAHPRSLATVMPGCFTAQLWGYEFLCGEVSVVLVTWGYEFLCGEVSLWFWITWGYEFLCGEVSLWFWITWGYEFLCGKFHLGVILFSTKLIPY
jgi:hypothetical protein